MGHNASEFDLEGYGTDVVDAVINSVLDSDHKVVTEIQREMETEGIYTATSLEGVNVPARGTLAVDIETPHASVTVELDDDHPAIEGIEMDDYRGGRNEDGTPSITERLDQE